MIPFLLGIGVIGLVFPVMNRFWLERCEQPMKGGIVVIYRKRVYRVIPERAEIFTRFFQEYLLPNQVKHGAKCIGRWINKEKTEITVIWEYESMEHYHKIEQKVRMDPLHYLAQKKRAEIGPLVTDMNEEFVYDTLDEETWRILD